MTKSELQLAHYYEVENVIEKSSDVLNLYGLQWKLEDLYLSAYQNKISNDDINLIIEVYKHKAKAKALEEIKKKVDDKVDAMQKPIKS